MFEYTYIIIMNSDADEKSVELFKLIDQGWRVTHNTGVAHGVHYILNRQLSEEELIKRQEQRQKESNNA